MLNYKVHVNVSPGLIKYASGMPQWQTKEGPKVYLTKDSHPHFDVKEGSMGYLWLSFAFKSLSLSRTPKGSKIVVIAKFPELIGRCELTNRKVDLMTIVVFKTSKGKIVLHTAYYGEAISSALDGLVSGRLS